MRFAFKPPYIKKNAFLWWLERILKSPVNIALILFCCLIWWQQGYFPLSWSEWQYRMLLQKQNTVLYEITYTLREMNSSSLQELGQEELKQRLEGYVAKLQQDYDVFFEKYRFHDRAMASLGKFYDQIGKNEVALLWWAKACQLTTKNVDIVNALAEGYSNTGDPAQAIELYESAVVTNPQLGNYHYNLGQMYYVFRKEAAALHGWDLETVMAKSLEQLELAKQCDRSNYEYASTYAETFYGAHILLDNEPWQDALKAWEECLTTRMTPEEEDMVRIHLVRISTYLKDPVQALKHFSEIKGPSHRKLALHLLEKSFPSSFAGMIQI
jgi:tetratricopeptide (TPR) repeat protein